MPFVIAFLLVPLIEIALFVVVGGAIGLWATLGLVLAAGLGGVLLLRVLGRQAMAELRRGTGRGMAPGEMALLAMAGVLFILPGFLSDVLALALLVPPLRRAIARALAARVTVVQAGMAQTRSDITVIDGVYDRVEPEAVEPQAPPSAWTRH